ncbi:MAG TPA: hypothetical protein VI942_09215, partial [Thermoanaerobaculia bacterium]|nr:hypothetical protein [Thermoanaerobaculia bacterium]
MTRRHSLAPTAPRARRPIAIALGAALALAASGSAGLRVASARPAGEGSWRLVVAGADAAAAS